jgi:16S rRNA C1402 N4-methylase RsmH
MWINFVGKVHLDTFLDSVINGSSGRVAILTYKEHEDTLCKAPLKVQKQNVKAYAFFRP